MIPDQINEIDINSLLEISDEEKQHIGQTYLEVLLNNISQDNYKKENESQKTMILSKNYVSLF